MNLACNPCEQRHRGWIARRDVGGQVILVGLRAAHQKGGDRGNADAASDVAHQVVDAGGIADLLLAQAAHAHGGERNKDEAHGAAVEEVGHDDRSHH